LPFCRKYGKIVEQGVIYIILLMVHSIQMAGVLLASFYIFIKSTQYNASINHKAIALTWCLLWAILYGTAPLFTQMPLMTPLACFTSIIFAFFLTRQKLETVISAYLLSFGISFVLNYLATAVVGSIITLLVSREHEIGTTLDFNQPVFLLMYAIIAALQLVLAFFLFRIRRFRKGFPFIFKRYTIVAALFFTGIILMLVTWVNMISSTEEEIFTSRIIYIAGVIIAGVGIYILIRRLISMFQAKKVQQNTADHYEKLYLEEKAKNEELNRQIRAKSSAIHNFADRLKSTEEAVADGRASLEDVQNLRKDWEGELDKIKGKTALPSTNVVAIDNLFEFYARQFKAEKIAFNVMVNGSIKYMVENTIKQGDLETLIVNHLNDAKKAVNASDGTFRSITAVIGVSGEHYEFTVLDSGIPFEVDTLVRLGTERVTTHAESGGGGIGFETTFTTMKATGASLIINEQEQSDADYSKSVTIRFDGKNKYIIETCRADEFPESDRFIVVSTVTYAEMT
jgi:signal transduction histidine kinase